jgi:Transposase DDE domain
MEDAMRCAHFTVTPAAVHRQATDLLLAFLRLADHGPKCTAPVLLSLLFAAAAHTTSLFAVCCRFRNGPSDEAARQALLATLPEAVQLQRRLNQAMAATLHKKLRGRRHPLACDLTLIAYHGQPFRDPREIYRGQAKHGTCNFHAYATLYLIRKGQRFTIAMTTVRNGEPIERVLQYLLRQAARVGIRPSYLLLDRGFYNTGVIRYLQAARYPFLMPVVCRARKKTGGSKIFRTWKRSGFSQYTLTAKRGRTKATVRIAVLCQNQQGRWGKRGRKALVYAFWGLQPKSCRWLGDLYRRRFAIETTYRQMNQGRVRTSTRNPLLRLLFVGIGLVLRNVWVWLHYNVLAKRQRGGRAQRLECMRFRTLLNWLAYVAEECFGVHDVIETDYPLEQHFTPKRASA